MQPHVKRLRVSYYQVMTNTNNYNHYLYSFTYRDWGVHDCRRKESDRGGRGKQLLPRVGVRRTIARSCGKESITRNEQ